MGWLYRNFDPPILNILVKLEGGKELMMMRKDDEKMMKR
jgi:hypothetical protein